MEITAFIFKLLDIQVFWFFFFQKKIICKKTLTTNYYLFSTVLSLLFPWLLFLLPLKFSAHPEKYVRANESRDKIIQLLFTSHEKSCNSKCPWPMIFLFHLASLSLSLKSLCSYTSTTKALMLITEQNLAFYYLAINNWVNLY